MSDFLTNTWKTISRWVSNLDPFLLWTRDHPYVSAAGFSTGLLGGLTVRYYLSRPRNLPPGPIGLPFIGTGLTIGFDFFHLHVHRLAQKYGDVMTFYFGSRPVVIISGLKAITETFSTGQSFSGRPDQFLAEIEGPFSEARREEWRTFKRFTITGLQKHGGPKSGLDQVILKQIKWIIDSWTKANGTPVRPIETFYRSTTNAMMAMIYGKTLDPDCKELREIAQLSIDALRGFNDLSIRSDLYPAWLKKILFYKMNKQLDSAFVGIRDFCLKEMEKRGNKSNVEPTNFLEHFLVNKGVKEMGGLAAFADSVAVNTIDPVESLSVILNWSMLYLAYFPEVQQKLRKAIDEVVASDDLVALTDRERLPLVESFLLEVQRHCHMVPFSTGHCTVDKDTMYRGYNIPPQCVIYANFYSVHMDPDLHPDPETFKPDRFLDEEGALIKTQTVFLFSIGERSCPGEQSSKMQLFLTIANIVKHCKISFPADRPKPPLQMQPCGSFMTPHEFHIIVQANE